MRTLIFLALVLAGVSRSVPAAEPTVLLELATGKIEVKLLKSIPDRMFVLARDGRLWDFPPEEPKSFKRVSESFSPLGVNELRSQLQREFGPRFEVAGGGRYVVVYPAGQRNLWADRFDELFRSFQHYFTARGLRPDATPFPLVAVVFPTQAEFVRYSLQEGVANTNGLLGYYSPRTNRVALFDATGGRPDVDWTATGETIIHEAAHQTAFNTGIHTRLADTPRWVVEGLGCLFEAKGVYNSRQFPARVDRLNRGRLSAFKRYASGRRKEGSLAEFVSSDRPFSTNIDAAYAEGWALSFFLSETEPRRYLEYLKKTGSLKPLEAYRAPERLRDFTAIFGPDLQMLETRFLRFIDEL